MISIKRKDWIEILLHIAFWVGVFYTLLSFTEPHIKMRINHNGTILQKDIQRTLSAHIFLSLGFMVVLFYGNTLWLLKKALRYKHVLIRVVLPVAWFSVIFLANIYLDTLLPAQKNSDPMLLMSPPPKSAHITINANVDRLKNQPFPDDNVRKVVAFQQSSAFIFATDGFSNTLLFIFIIVFGLSIAYFFLKEWTRAEKFRIQLAAVQLDTEIKFLKSQVYPHFLFNTLNNLFSMAQDKGNDELADGISKLSGMMRYMIYESNAEKVPLADEIAYIKNCIALNKLRYADDEALVTFEYPGQIRNILIAPMLFIPFVENAFKHGILINRPSRIAIAISASDKEVIFSCENENFSFIKRMDDQTSGIGLENVKRRLELVYPGKYRLDIKNSDDKYAVTLKIDLE